MAFIVSDRTQDTSTSTGSGPFVLSGTAPAGFQTFGTGIGNGNVTYYEITDGTNWMTCIGTYTASGLSLSVTTVLASSAGGTTPVSFAAGTKTVFCTYPASKSVIQDVNNSTSVNGLAPNVTVTTSAGGTTTLTAASSYYQRVIGTLSQTIKLPDQTTLPVGATFVIDNDSTQNILITDSAGVTLATGVPGAAGLFYTMANGSATGNWGGYAYLPASVQWGSGALGSAYGGTGLTSPGTSGYVLTSTGTGWTSSPITPTGSTYSRTSFTATSGQTTFSVTYNVGYIAVYLNGVFLNGTDYTATNGTSVVLALSANTGDIVETIAYTTTSIGTASTSTNLAGGLAGEVPYQSGAGVTAFTTVGVTSQVLTSQGASAPIWAAPATTTTGKLYFFGQF